MNDQRKNLLELC